MFNIETELNKYCSYRIYAVIAPHVYITTCLVQDHNIAKSVQTLRD